MNKINRQAILGAITAAAAAVPGRTPKDILKGVLISGSHNEIEIVGTDQEIGLRVKITTEEKLTPFEVVVNPGKLQAILRESTDEFVSIDVDRDVMKVVLSNGRFKIMTEDAREFPPVPVFDEEKFWSIPGTVLSSMIKRTEFACDSESTRYALGGALFEVENGKLTVAATDSRRLAVATAAIENQNEAKMPEKKTVVPAKALRLVKSLAESSTTVNIAFHDNDLMVSFGNSTLYTRLVEGRFPRYRDVIPRKQPIHVPIAVGPLFRAVRQAQIVTDEEHRGVVFKFGDSLMKLASIATIGSSDVEVPIEYDGEAMEITLDPVYIADVLKVLPQEAVVDLNMTDAETAIVFTVDDSYTYVVMPLANDR